MRSDNGSVAYCTGRSEPAERHLFPAFPADMRRIMLSAQSSQTRIIKGHPASASPKAISATATTPKTSS